MSVLTKQNFRRFAWLFLTAVLVLAAGLAVSSSRPRAGGEEDEGLAVAPKDLQVRVKVAAIHRGTLSVTLKAAGKVVPGPQGPAVVVARAAGVVAEVNVRDGETVSSGTALVCLDPRPARNALAKARAALRSAEAALRKARGGDLAAAQFDLETEAKQAEAEARQARLESDKQQSLLAEHLTSGKAAAAARLTMEAAERKTESARAKAASFRATGRTAEQGQLEATVDQARADVAAAELDLDATRLCAPHAGRVSGLKATVGGAVEANTVVAEVLGSGSSMVEIYLSPADAEAVKVGCALTAEAAAGEKPLTGTVVSVGGELDSETGLVPVLARIEPDGSRMPRVGETVLAEITTRADCRGMVAPVAALLVEEDKATVCVVDAKEIAHVVPVAILTRNARSAVISGSGLSDGAKLVVDGSYNLPDGAHVIEETAR